MENSAESPFSKVIQLGIVVKDLEKTVERLTALGIGPFKRSSLPPEREEWFRQKRMYADFKFASAYIGDMQIELIEPVSGDSPHKEFLETKGEGIQHIACAVKDLRKEVDKLSQMGVEILLRAKFPSGGGAAYCDLGSGFIVELVERK
jgi:methylmalonyl-CoA/ethylmalonyl-CoA epimerase